MRPAVLVRKNRPRQHANGLLAYLRILSPRSAMCNYFLTLNQLTARGGTTRDKLHGVMRRTPRFDTCRLGFYALRCFLLVIRPSRLHDFFRVLNYFCSTVDSYAESDER